MKNVLFIIMLKCDIITLKIYLCIRISAKYKKGNAKSKTELLSFLDKFIM